MTRHYIIGPGTGSDAYRHLTGGYVIHWSCMPDFLRDSPYAAATLARERSGMTLEDANLPHNRRRLGDITWLADIASSPRATQADQDAYLLLSWRAAVIVEAEETGIVLPDGRVCLLIHRIVGRAGDIHDSNNPIDGRGPLSPGTEVSK